MKLDKFEIIDRCLYWKEEEVLVVGDLHLGYEENLSNSGVNLPSRQFDESYELFERVFSVVGGKLKKIILLGDVKHYFGGVLKSEFGDFYGIVNLLKKNLYVGGKIVIVKGNHDNILGPVVSDYDFVELVDYYVLGGVAFLHGDRFSFKKIGLKVFEKDVELVVVGHFHLAINIGEKRGGIKREVYKCFLFGKSNELKKKMILVPSFFPLVEGKDVLGVEGVLEGMVDVRGFDVFVLSGEFGGVLGFGKLKELM